MPDPAPLSPVPDRQRLLHQVAICVVDIERSVAFYEAMLQPLGIRRVVDRMPIGVALGYGQGEFWIQSPDAQPFLRITKFAHYAFVAASRAELMECERIALERGARQLMAPAPTQSGRNLACVFSDPDGNMVEILTAIGP